MGKRMKHLKRLGQANGKRMKRAGAAKRKEKEHADFFAPRASDQPTQETRGVGRPVETRFYGVSIVLGGGVVDGEVLSGSCAVPRTLRRAAIDLGNFGCKVSIKPLNANRL